jgi:UDP-N-acetyl-2-amino-2-deoxyglucuronate dehydrogenase
MQILRFALVGCGRIGEKHASIISKLGKLEAVIDLLTDRVQKFTLLYNAKGYNLVNTFLEQESSVDVVVICTPNGLHAEQAIACLEKGIHVLLEKPVALHEKDIISIQAAASKSSKFVFPVMQNRFNAALVTIKELLDKGLLGKVFGFQINCFWNRPASYYENSWHGDKYLDGGILYTQLSHFIDILSWYFGDCEHSKGFVTKASDKQIDFEDTGNFVLLYPDNIIGSINYTVNTAPKNIEGSFTIHTEKGTIKIGGAYLNMVEINTTPYVLNINQSSANDYGSYTGSGAYHDAVYDNLLDVFNGRSEYYTSLEEAAITIRTIEKMYLSVRI